MADFMSGLLGIGQEEDPRAAAQRAGLLGIASQLLSAGGPSLTPTSLGQALGPAILGGRQMAQQSMTESSARMLQQQKQQEEAAFKQMLPQVFVDGKPDYTKLQQLVSMFPERGRVVADALQKAAGPDTIQVDVGNEIQIRTKQGDIVSRIPKGLAPQAAQRETFSLNPEMGVLVGSLGTIRPATLPDGTPVKPKGKVSMQTLFDDQGKEFKALVDESTGQYTPVAGAKAPSLQYDAPTGTVFNPAGGVVTPAMTPEGKPIAPPAPKLTEGQAAASGFLLRMNEAEKIFSSPIDPDNPESKTREQLGLYPGLMSGAAGSIPLVGSTAANAVQGKDQQMYAQAKSDWIRAKLRKESGATIQPEEFRGEDVTYFPQPGDSKEVIEQKRNSRENAQKQFKFMAGPGAETVINQNRQQNQNQSSTAQQPKRYKYNQATGRIEEVR